MKYSRANALVSASLSLLSLTGCAATIRASASATATPTHAEARARVDVDADPRALAVAGVVGAGLIGAVRDAHSRSQPPVRTDTGNEGSQAGSAVEIDDLTLASAAGDVRIEVQGGSLVMHAPGAGGSSRVVGGNVVVVPAGGASSAWSVSSGTLVFVDGSERAVSRGDVRVQRDASGAWVLAGGEIDAGDARAAGWSTTASTALAHASGTAGSESSAPEVTRDGAIDARASANATVTVSLGARALASLDGLMEDAPPGSRDQLRAAAAVQTVIHDAESADPNLYGVPVAGASVVVVLDVSYSMSEPDPHGVAQALDPHALPTKLDVARAETVKLLAELPVGTEVDVVAFSTAVRTLWPAPRPLDERSLHEAIRWLAGLHPEDETHPLPAVDAAVTMRPAQLVLVSDGRPTDHDEADAQLLAIADATHAAGGRMDAVGLGDDQDGAFLDELARRGGGVARHR